MSSTESPSDVFTQWSDYMRQLWGTAKTPVDPWWRGWADAMTTATETGFRLSREYVDLTRAALSADTDQLAAGRAFLDSVGRESERYWRALTELGVGYAAEVVELGARASDAVLRDVTAAARNTQPQDDHPADSA